MVDFPRPSTVKELQGFLGIVNFYRRFLPWVAKVLKPLTNCLRGGPKGTTIISWEASMETSFENAKQLPASAAQLGYLDQAAKLSMAVDASATHVRRGLPAAAAVQDSRLGAASCFFKEAGAGSGQIFCI